MPTALRRPAEPGTPPREALRVRRGPRRGNQIASFPAAAARQARRARPRRSRTKHRRDDAGPYPGDRHERSAQVAGAHPPCGARRGDDRRRDARGERDSLRPAEGGAISASSPATSSAATRRERGDERPRHHLRGSAAASRRTPRRRLRVRQEVRRRRVARGRRDHAVDRARLGARRVRGDRLSGGAVARSPLRQDDAAQRSRPTGAPDHGRLWSRRRPSSSGRSTRTRRRSCSTRSTRSSTRSRRRPRGSAPA